MINPTNLIEIFEKSQVGPVLGTYLKYKVHHVNIIHVAKITPWRNNIAKQSYLLLFLYS
jgi:hypothetical protein